MSQKVRSPINSKDTSSNSHIDNGKKEEELKEEGEGEEEEEEGEGEGLEKGEEEEEESKSASNLLQEQIQEIMKNNGL